jgi:hypothetical protein
VQTAQTKQRDIKERKVLIQKSQIMETWLEYDTFRSKTKKKDRISEQICRKCMRRGGKVSKDLQKDF